MKTFREFIEFIEEYGIEEALKIVKKREIPDKRDDIITTIHKKEIDVAKEEFGSLYVGKIDDIIVKKSRHVKEIRDGEKFPRDFGLDNEFLLSKIVKAMKSSDFKEDETVRIIYKNLDQKYDLAVISKHKNLITVITLIQQSKPTASKLIPLKHEGEINIIVEKWEEDLLEGIFIIVD